jgi:hypothetical protein
VPAVRAGQRPVLARNDPLNIFGRQRQQTLLISRLEDPKLIVCTAVCPCLNGAAVIVDVS